MSYYLLTIGSKAPKISYRCSNQRLFTSPPPPANGEDEFKINDYLRDFSLDLINQIVRNELLERAKLLLEYLFDPL